MIEIIRKNHQPEVLISGKAVEIRDTYIDNVLVDAKLEDLDNVVATNLPTQITIYIKSEDGFGTNFIEELIIHRKKGNVTLDFFFMSSGNFWDGYYGLGTFINSIDEQSKNFQDLETDCILTDGLEAITISKVLEEQDHLRSSINEAIISVNKLIQQAEIALGGLVWKDCYLNNEDLFCRERLEPMLSRMGFLFVRYTHGRREYGKDFTFSEMSPFGALRHYGLQAKAGNVSGKVNSQVDELIGQVEDAFAMPYYQLGCSDKRYISTFIIAISGHFTENAREKIVEKIPAKLLGSVWFLDRTRIDELILRYWQKSNQ